MLQKLIVFIGLTAISTFSNPIGDFAPLEVGNVWVYRIVLYANSGYGYDFHIDSSITTIELQSIEERNDTTFNIFRNMASGRFIEDTTQSISVDPDKLDTTYYSDSVFFDTLYEFEGVIGNVGKYEGRRHFVPTLPVFTMHEIDTMMLDTFDTLRVIDDTFEYEEVFYLPSYNRKYRTGIGLYSAVYISYNHGSDRHTTTLLSFTRNGEIIAGVQSQNPKIISAKFSTAPAKSSLSLPHLNIVKGYRTFNLLGKVTGERGQPGKSLRMKGR